MNTASIPTVKSEKIILFSALLFALIDVITLLCILNGSMTMIDAINKPAILVFYLILCVVPAGLVAYTMFLRQSVNKKTPNNMVPGELQAPAARLEALLESSPIGFLLIDNNYIILEFNSLMNDFARIAWLQPLQKNENLLKFLPPERVADFTGRYEAMLRGEKTNYQVAYPWGDGNSTNFDMNLNPMRNNGNAVIGCCISSEDISVRVAEGNKISELNTVLERRVAERTAKYEAVNQELEAFTFSVSHDLRSPLRAVNSYAQIMLEDYGNAMDEDGRNILERIRYNGQKMGNLIDELLSFSKLGRKDIQREAVNLDELVQHVVTDLRQQYPADGKIIVGQLPVVQADYTLLYQVMYNLLSNAIKYSSKVKQPVIEIFATQKNDKTIFAIKDNGAGFDMQYADKLFGVFQRLHSEKQFEGNGVGLAIVKRIITKFGGAVWGEGKENEGATFYFTLN